MKRVLDKMRFLKSFPKQHGYMQYKSHLGAAHQQVAKGDFKLIHVPHQTVFYKPFKGANEKTGLRISFGSSSAGTYIAIECTPRKLTDDEWIEARECLTSIFGGPEFIAKKFRLFELEFAVDIPQPISNFIYVAPRLRAKNTLAEIKGWTVFGSKQGNRYIRIYDKKKQLKQKKGILVSHPQTRIEVVRRRLETTLDKCISFPNPFGEIIALPRHLIPDIRKKYPTDYALSHFCGKISKGATGQVAYWDIEDADLRKLVCKRIEPFAFDLVGKASEWDKWISAELSCLKERFKPGFYP